MANSGLMKRLSQPCLEDTILEIRTSRMKPMTGTAVLTGIDKKLRNGELYLTTDGFVDDEHDLTFHGGIDKAILVYCSANYSPWNEAYPDKSDVFVPGGFGENFVLANMNERNVHIGDIVQVGETAVMQVSLPRSPCFKLNHRFKIRNFAPETYRYSRTGIYYRVLVEGPVKAGDKITVIERRHPQWTIERVQEYLHRNTSDDAMNEQLAAIEEMGDEARKKFRQRVDAAQSRAADAVNASLYRQFEIIARKMETQRIVSLAFKATEPNRTRTKPLGPGSHVELKLPNGLTRSYSVVSSKSKDHFVLGIALDDNSRGGSRYMHQEAKCGNKISVRVFERNLENVKSASHHVFIVGGIGITAFLDILTYFRRCNFSFDLHYAIRSEADKPFAEHLRGLGDGVTLYDGTKGERMDIRAIVKSLEWNSHLYVCGPEKMMQAAKIATQEFKIADGDIHWEAFQADASGDPFEAVIANKENTVVRVGAKESLLEALRREFGDVASSCEVGNCGTCVVKVKCGRIEHRGVALSAEERELSMLSCVSRGVGRITVEL